MSAKLRRARAQLAIARQMSSNLRAAGEEDLAADLNSQIVAATSPSGGTGRQVTGVAAANALTANITSLAGAAAALSPISKALAARGGTRKLSTSEVLFIQFGSKARIFQAMVVHVIFIIFFTALTLRDSFDDNIFFFGDKLREQYGGVEFSTEHSPSWGKAWEDVSTIEEFHEYLQGPFLAATFPPLAPARGFGVAADGGTAAAAVADGWRGAVRPVAFGRMVAVGAVRISQVRQRTTNCTDVTSPMRKLALQCYSRPLSTNFGEFSLASEDKGAFGAFQAHSYSAPQVSSEPERALNRSWPLYKCTARCLAQNATPFLYGGVQGWDGMPLAPCTGTARAGSAGAKCSAEELQEAGEAAVSRTRAHWFGAGEYTRHWNWYPSPAFAVTLDPSQGPAVAARVLRDLNESRYVDTRSRAVFVDVTYYNADVNRVGTVRLVMELTKASGVRTDMVVDVTRLWDFVGDTDKSWFGMMCVAALFYLYFGKMALRRARRVGWRKFLKSGWALFEIINLVVFFSFFFLRFVAFAAHDFPTHSGGARSIDVASARYFEARPAVHCRLMAEKLAGINVFLNWFKLISVLSYLPAFNLMTETLAQATRNVAGFFFIFIILFVTFAHAHTLIFHGKLEPYRDLGQSMFTLMRSLLGDFDFVQQASADYLMGPALFCVYLLVTFFVILNIVIAIISDAYTEQRMVFAQRSKAKQNFNLVRETMRACLGCVRSCIGKSARKAQEQNKQGARVHPVAPWQKRGGGAATLGRIAEVEAVSSAEVEAVSSSDDEDAAVDAAAQLAKEAAKRKKKGGKKKKMRRNATVPRGISAELKAVFFRVTVPPGPVGLSIRQLDAELYERAQRRYEAELREVANTAKVTLPWQRKRRHAKAMAEAVARGNVTHAAPSRCRVNAVRPTAGFTTPALAAMSPETIPIFFVGVNGTDLTEASADEATQALVALQGQRRVLRFVKLVPRDGGTEGEDSKAAAGATPKAAEDAAEELPSAEETSAQLLEQL
eukprot:g3490.t1